MLKWDIIASSWLNMWDKEKPLLVEKISLFYTLIAWLLMLCFYTSFLLCFIRRHCLVVVYFCSSLFDSGFKWQLRGWNPHIAAWSGENLFVMLINLVKHPFCWIGFSVTVWTLALFVFVFVFVFGSVWFGLWSHITEILLFDWLTNRSSVLVWFLLEPLIIGICEIQSQLKLV